MNNLLDSLRMYYHVKDNNSLSKVLVKDLLATVLFIGGSGLFLSILRGFYYKLLLNYKNPALIGKGFKVINSSNFSAGKNIWIKDFVSILAGGRIKMGNNNVLCERVSIWSHEKGVSFGDNVAIGIGSYICGTGGKIEIGNEVRIADNVRMYSFNHVFSNPKKAIASQGYTRKGIFIGNNVWIGSGSVVLDGVKIGKNSVIAAGSVVTKNIPDNVLAGGVPAKLIRKLTNDK